MACNLGECRSYVSVENSNKAKWGMHSPPYTKALLDPECAESTSFSLAVKVGALLSCSDAWRGSIVAAHPVLYRDAPGLRGTVPQTCALKILPSNNLNLVADTRYYPP